MDHYSYDPANPGAAADDAAHQRAAARDSLLLTAQLKLGDAAPVQVRVRNLSAGGLMAEHAAPVERDIPVAIDVRGIGWVRGRIAWAAEGRLGIAFDTPIDPLLARKPVGQGKHTPHYVKPILPVR